MQVGIQQEIELTVRIKDMEFVNTPINLYLNPANIRGKNHAKALAEPVQAFHQLLVLIDTPGGKQ